jgi:arylsulfatase A-like enzyme
LRRPSFELLETRSLLAGVLPPTIDSLARDTSTAGFHFTLTGTSEPNAQIAVHQLGVSEVGSTTSDGTGRWSFHHSNAALAQGRFSYTAVASTANGTSEPSAARLFQPNFVLVNTDDMRADELDSQFMPFTSQVLGGQGTVFENSFVPTSLSGPSRASLLTGQYAHHTGVLGQSAPLGGDANRDDASTLATWLQDAGYRTGIYGKHETVFDDLDTTNTLEPPPGWDEFHVRIGGAFYDLKENRNGTVEKFGRSPQDYSTDVFAEQADGFLRSTEPSQPFFMYFAPFAPHSPFTPAPRHLRVSPDLEFDRPASFNQIPNDIQRLPMTAEQIEFFDEVRASHLRSLLAVDEAIGKFYSTLNERGELDNSIFIFTADNGFQWGEHGISSNKHTFYEESLRVPLLIHDGRAPAARTPAAMALNIDLAPTLSELAGASAPAVDGVSLVPWVYGDSATPRQAFLIEDWWEPATRSFTEGYGESGQGIRTNQWKYAEYQSGRVELFDLVNDPGELVNLATSPAHVGIRSQLAQQLNLLRPADRTGPRVENLTAQVGTDSRGFDGLRIDALVSDTSRPPPVAAA